jgi:hypothetical protein
MVPSLGGLLNALCYLIVEYAQGSLEWLYAGNFFEGILGGHLTFVGSCCAYCFDTIRPEDSAFRFLILQTVYFLGSAVTSLVIGYIVSGLGYCAAFIFIASCYGVVLLYTLFILPESLPKVSQKPFQIHNVVKSLVSSVKVLFRERENPDDLLAVQLIFTVLATVAIVATGSINLVTAYSVAPPFCLDSVGIGFLIAISSVTVVIVGPLVIKIGSIFFSDEFITLVCLFITAVTYALIGVSNTTTMLYIGR